MSLLIQARYQASIHNITFNESSFSNLIDRMCDLLAYHDMLAAANQLQTPDEFSSTLTTFLALVNTNVGDTFTWVSIVNGTYACAYALYIKVIKHDNKCYLKVSIIVVLSPTAACSTRGD